MPRCIHLIWIGLVFLLAFIACMASVIVTVEMQNVVGASLLSKRSGYAPRDQDDNTRQDKNFASITNADDQTSSNDEDELLKHNLNLIRSRPRNTTIVFIGDSVMRYQYLSLAYFFKSGRWYDPKQSTKATNLLYRRSFFHPFVKGDGWNEFFTHSNLMLYPMEICDCHRNEDIRPAVILERRYFFDKKRNNRLVFINLNGNQSTVTGSTELIGRIPFLNKRVDQEQQQHERNESDALSIFDNFDYYLNEVPFLSPRNRNFRPPKGLDEPQIQWRYNTWGEVIQHHVSTLLPKQPRFNGSPNHSSRNKQTFAAIVLNAGRHLHDFTNISVQIELAKSINNTIASTAGSILPGDNEPVMTFWRTTSVSRQELVELHKTKKRYRREEDYQMCELLGGCLDIFWAQDIPPLVYYADKVHFTEPIYRIMNEDLLKQMQALPHGYVKLDKRSVMKYNLTGHRIL